MDAAFLDLTIPASDAAGRKTVIDDAVLIADLQEIVGHAHVLTSPAMVDHFKALDPNNAFNPGIGRTTKCAHWMPRGQTYGKPGLRCES